MTRILVIGGYGAVGTEVCKQLNTCKEVNVIIAGRNISKAEHLASQMENTRVIKLDITKPIDAKVFKGIDIVINCIEDNQYKAVRHCTNSGTHFIDISANFSYSEGMKRFANSAKLNQTTVALGVGLAPGLTNLMVKHLIAKAKSNGPFDIFLMLGAAEKHGAQAIEWTLKNLGTPFKLNNAGQVQTVRSFKERKKCEAISKNNFYRLNISDQHSLKNTLNISNISTWFTLDSSFATGMLKYTATFLRFRLFRKIFARLNRLFSFGSEKFVLRVENQSKPELSLTLEGLNEAKATGTVAASLALFLAAKKTPSGIYYIDELFNLSQVLEHRLTKKVVHLRGSNLAL